MITGTTGFVGKVLLEKILRSFPDVKQIFISIRAKNESEVYNRYKKEIKDSMIFDALKLKIGLKSWRKLLKNKVKLLPMDL